MTLISLDQLLLVIIILHNLNYLVTLSKTVDWKVVKQCRYLLLTWIICQDRLTSEAPSIDEYLVTDWGGMNMRYCCNWFVVALLNVISTCCCLLLGCHLFQGRSEQPEVAGQRLCSRFYNQISSKGLYIPELRRFWSWKTFAKMQIKPY